jgi:hypothetical protein
MANATININAVDNTRSAFLAVQRGLQKVKSEAQKTAQGLLKPLSGAGLGAGLGAALGVNLRSIGDNVARMITGVTKVSEDALKSLVATGSQLADITEGRMRSRRTDDQQIALLQDREARKLAEIAELQRMSEEVGRQGTGEVIARRLGDMIGITSELKNQDVLMARISEANLALNQMIAEREGLQGVGAPSKALLEQHADAMRAAGTANAPLKLSEQIDSLSSSYGRLMGELAKRPAGETEIQRLEREIKIYKDMAKVRSDLHVAEEKRLQVTREAGKILADGFEEAVFSGEKLSKVIAQLGQDILRLVFRNTITTPLANILSAGIPKLFGFADGGLPPTGRPSIVGERGPELFIPGTSGRIVPNHDLGGGGGGGQTYYIDARGADQTGLARLESMIRETRASIRPVALSAVMDARARGGSMGRAA